MRRRKHLVWTVAASAAWVQSHASFSDLQALDFEPKQPALPGSKNYRMELATKTIEAGQRMLSAKDQSSVINVYEPRFTSIGLPTLVNIVH